MAEKRPEVAGQLRVPGRKIKGSGIGTGVARA
jgi:hypothetical protein